MLARMKVMPFGFVRHDACAFDDGKHLVCGVNVRFRSRSVVEEDRNDLEFFALVACHKVVHVNVPLEVVGVGWPGFGLVGF